MRAIVLAAGKGSRISDKIGAIPKSLLKINEKTILETLVDKLLSQGIGVTVCVGYRHCLIEDALKERPVKVSYNPFYELMNNIGTLWFARDTFMQNDDVLILSADLIFDMAILEKLKQSTGDLVMATDSDRIQTGDYFFSLDQNGKIVEYGPNVPVEKRTCEYMGISMVKQRACNAFCKKLEDMIDHGDFQQYFEQVFFSFRNDPAVQLRTVDVAGLPWQEIDFYEDYQKALNQFR